MNSIALKSELEARELLLLESEVKSRGKSMLVGYVLWYFLGMLGAHRFYLGYKGSAITMLVLSITLVGLIITSVWALVDAFLLHSWIRERNDSVEATVVGEIMKNRQAAATMEG